MEADDFLHKPFRIERLKQAIKKIAHKTTAAIAEEEGLDSFFIKISGTQSKYYKFLYRDIIAFESDKNYIIIYTPNDSHRIYMTIHEVESKLAGRTEFMKVHRSFIISKAYIDQVQNNLIIMKKSRIKNHFTT